MEKEQTTQGLTVYYIRAQSWIVLNVILMQMDVEETINM